jgi:hypothetical protein
MPSVIMLNVNMPSDNIVPVLFFHIILVAVVGSASFGQKHLAE